MYINNNLEYVIDDDMANYLGVFAGEKKIFDAIKKLKLCLLDWPLSGISHIQKYHNKNDHSCIRTLTVSRIAFGSPESRLYKSVPFIRLQGPWLEKLGFRQGNRVQVVAHKGFLMVLPSRNKASEID